MNFSRTEFRAVLLLLSAAFGLLTDWGGFKTSLFKAGAALPHILLSLTVVGGFFSVAVLGPYWFFSGKKWGFVFFFGSLFAVTCSIWPAPLLLKAISEQTLSEISFFLLLTALCSAACGFGSRRAEKSRLSSQES